MTEKKKYPLEKEDYFQLWKFFNEDSTNIKDKLWTTASWLFTLMGGVLAFIGQYVEADKMSFTHPMLVGVMAIVGIVLCIYAWWMITVYGKHIRTAWNRSDYLWERLDGLEEVWQSGYANPERKEGV